MVSFRIIKQPTPDDKLQRIDKRLIAGVDYLTPAQVAAIYQTILGFKINHESRDMTLASGDVSYTGYGFQPVNLMIWGSYSNKSLFQSFVDAGKYQHLILVGSGISPHLHQIDRMIWLWSASGVQQIAILKSYDADGFTLTWTKAGLPTGIGYFTVYAVK